MGRLLVVGELCVDLIVELDGPIDFGQAERIVPSTTLAMGSSSAITACGAARLGVPTSLVSVRGDDVFGRFLASELDRLGVEQSQVRVDASTPTGSSTHLTRPDGDRAILTAMGSIGAVRAEDVDLAGAARIHVGSYFLQHALWPGLPGLFAEARARGIPTSLDPNFDPAETWDSGLLPLLEHVDVLFCNEQEATGITGEESLDAAIDALLAAMPADARVIAKRGAEGAVLASGDARTLATAPALEWPLVDTVGAGDSLAAGYLAAILRGLPPTEALRWGVAAGTLSTRAAGGTGQQATAEEAERFARLSTVA
ncbi:carbohydrate kinase family protein [Salinibacterium soli]|uniref:Carbohydrate kinase family protein n=1 Tax=Antiquaquibacter soli TaxID=3064523 RepID=A0ABT9BPT6_9MICO|nr:carbohydrate kinase family protein [Protaetiibacter sp. WY-16]MDO7883033.1 carbohydrate kinase family protein [Protaetiibacter sp. WY-16]